MVVTQSMVKPGKREMAKLKRVRRYVKGTVDLTILFGREEGNKGKDLAGFVGADHAGDKDNGYSTTGYGLVFGRQTSGLEITKANCGITGEYSQ